jgi:hypothetical protein
LLLLLGGDIIDSSSKMTLLTRMLEAGSKRPRHRQRSCTCTSS